MNTTLVVIQTVTKNYNKFFNLRSFPMPFAKSSFRLALALACLNGVSSAALAQSALAGFYGQVGIGYERTDTSNNSVVSSSGGNSVTLNPTGSNPHRSNFAGAIGIGVYIPVHADFLLGLGAEYQPLSQQTSSYTVASPGQASLNGSYKVSNRYNIFFSPAIAVNKTGLAYAKVGFTGQSLQGNSGFLSPLSQNQTGYSLGLGYRQVIQGGLYGFAEANYYSYSKPNAGVTSGNTTYAVNPGVSAYNGLIGIGYRF
jgi:outer membrane immunogenic protein